MGNLDKIEHAIKVNRKIAKAMTILLIINLISGLCFVVGLVFEIENLFGFAFLLFALSGLAGMFIGLFRYDLIIDFNIDQWKK